MTNGQHGAQQERVGHDPVENATDDRHDGRTDEHGQHAAFQQPLAEVADDRGWLR